MKSPIFQQVNDQLKEHLKFPMEKEMGETMKEVSRIFAENKNAMAMAFTAETGCDPANVVCVTQGTRMWYEPQYDPKFYAIYVTKDGFECVERLLNDQFRDRPMMIVKRPIRDPRDCMAYPAPQRAIPHFEQRTYELTGQKKKGLWVYREV